MPSQEDLDSVTKELVDLLSYGKYATRTSDTVEFNTIKELMSDYITTNVPMNKFRRGLGLLTCHYYACDDTQNPEEGDFDDVAGLITTDRTGERTVVRSLPYLSDVEGFKMYLMRSRYGTEFLYMMKTFKTTVLTT